MLRAGLLACLPSFQAFACVYLHEYKKTCIYIGFFPSVTQSTVPGYISAANTLGYFSLWGSNCFQHSLSSANGRSRHSHNVRIPDPVPTPSSTVGTVITFAYLTSRLLAPAGPAFRRRPGVPAPARLSGAGPASYGRPGLVAGTSALPIISTCVDLNWQAHISQMKKALKAGMLRNWFSLSQKYLAGIGMGG